MIEFNDYGKLLREREENRSLRAKNTRLKSELEDLVRVPNSSNEYWYLEALKERNAKSEANQARVDLNEVITKRETENASLMESVENYRQRLESAVNVLAQKEIRVDDLKRKVKNKDEQIDKQARTIRHYQERERLNNIAPIVDTVVVNHVETRVVTNLELAVTNFLTDIKFHADPEASAARALTILKGEEENG